MQKKIVPSNQGTSRVNEILPYNIDDVNINLENWIKQVDEYLLRRNGNVQKTARSTTEIKGS